MATISSLSSPLYYCSPSSAAASICCHDKLSFIALPHTPPALQSVRHRRSLSFSPAPRRATRVSVTEEETAVSAEELAAASEEGTAVAVPVSPSDVLTMFFQAEGVMDESAVSTVTKALEGLDGVSDLRVAVSEGIASVELTKQTTVQATGVASNLVEVIQGSGFKLQTLNLSFEDEEDAAK